MEGGENMYVGRRRGDKPMANRGSCRQCSVVLSVANIVRQLMSCRFVWNMGGEGGNPRPWQGSMVVGGWMGIFGKGTIWEGAVWVGTFHLEGIISENFLFALKLIFLTEHNFFIASKIFSPSPNYRFQVTLRK